MASGTGSFLKVIFKNFDVLAGPAVSLVYPLYASIQAIESKNPVDDQQWLTYWVLNSMMTLFELSFARPLEWIPIWPYLKLIITGWLVMPQFSGAAYVYEQYVRPLFLNPPKFNNWYLPKRTQGITTPDDIRAVAQKYIEEHGPEAFEKLISRADKSRSSSYSSYTKFENKSMSHGYMNFDDEYSTSGYTDQSKSSNYAIVDDSKSMSRGYMDYDDNKYSSDYSVFNNHDYGYY